MARTVVGLEIHEAGIRAVELSRGRRPALVAAGEVALPPGVAKDSEVLDVDAVAMAITPLWSQAGIKAKEAVVGIANRRVLVREHSTPALRPDLMRAALPFDVQDLLPVPPEQAVLDFYPISESGGQVHGLLVAAVSESVEGLIAALNRARIRTAAVDFVPFGLARVAKVVAPPGQTVAVVAIGEHTTNLVVAQDGVPRFARIIPLDLGASAERAEQQFEDVPEQLPQARRAFGFAPADAVAPAVSDLVGRIDATLNFHARRRGASPADTIFLTGAGLDTPGLLPLATSTLDAPVFAIDVHNLVPPDRGAPITGRLAASLLPTLGVILGEEHL